MVFKINFDSRRLDLHIGKKYVYMPKQSFNRFYPKVVLLSLIRYDHYYVIIIFWRVGALTGNLGHAVG